ncbi:hypothetical protein [Streptomyces sp. 8L]|uniref:hypothetical protein n=1 Tax=Streptomyces sp. 8L TaxID=2877242 RepID=UPI001CD72595|nr:hypothetical protein [Streptomyces sp. 8L]MCA1221752.1 hypothetical protein [Streptomyces sp. 8L]
MRPQLSLSAAAAVACAALALGTAGPATAAAHSPHDTGRGLATARPGPARGPLPDAATPAGQVGTLKNLSGVLAPVTTLLDTVVKADHDKLADAGTARLAADAERAIAAAKSATASATTANSRADTPADTVGKALDALKKSVDDLAAGAAAGDTQKTGDEVTATTTQLVNVIVANVLDGGLPKPTLPDLPDLPAQPGTGDPEATTLPASVTPGASTLPAFAHPGLTDPSALLD